MSRTSSYYFLRAWLMEEAIGSHDGRNFRERTSERIFKCRRDAVAPIADDINYLNN